MRYVLTDLNNGDNNEIKILVLKESYITLQVFQLKIGAVNLKYFDNITLLVPYCIKSN